MAFPPLTPTQIRATLAAVSPYLQAGQGAAIAPPLRQRYQHIMAMYAIAQRGDVNTQRQLVQARQHQQIANLREELGADQPALLQRELAELEAAIAWQLEQLAIMDPESEAAIHACLEEIETFLQQL